MHKGWIGALALLAMIFAGTVASAAELAALSSPGLSGIRMAGFESFHRVLPTASWDGCSWREMGPSVVSTRPGASFSASATSVGLEMPW